jgi:NitT/TauT family transport system substrate-binding protein
MAKRKLTTFSKFLIVLLVVGLAFVGIQYLQRSGILSDLGGESGSKPAAGAFKRGEVVRIGVVTWGGYAGGQYFNEGFAANKESRFFKEYGVPVEFRVIDDIDNSLAAWKNGDLDLHWYTIDAFPTIVGGLRDFDPVVVWQADWSRGGDAVVARRGVNSVADLRGKKVAVAELTPSHSFLLWLLDAGGLSANDIQVVPQASAIDAAAAFKSQQVDAAVVWSPDDEDCLRAVPGARILESTRSASNIIADIFFAKRDFVDKNRDKLQKIYEGWMRGAAEINASPANKDKAVRILSEGLGIPESDARVAIDNVRLVTHGDNLNFFDLNPDFKGVTGSALYLRMANDYQKLGFASSNIPNWRNVAYPALVQRASLSSPEHQAEGQRVFTQVTAEQAKDLEAFATKRITITFRTAEFELDENAKYIIDREFADIAKAFGNVRIRIEGNTDNVGSRESNVRLSQRRAKAVADYLAAEYGMDANRFIVVGNGPDKPIASNDSADGRAKNRRTDFELVRE